MPTISGFGAGRHVDDRAVEGSRLFRAALHRAWGVGLAEWVSPECGIVASEVIGSRAAALGSKVA